MDDFCLPTENEEYRSWILLNSIPIGESSAFGQIFHLCKKDKSDCNYVLKVMKRTRDNPNVFDMMKREVEMQNLCSKGGLCKEVSDYWFCKDKQIGVIITPILKQTVGRYIETQGITSQEFNSVYLRSIELVLKLHLYGMAHRDCHVNNIMFSHDNELYFIDMEKADIIKYEYITKDYEALNFGFHHILLKNKYLDDKPYFYLKEMVKDLQAKIDKSYDDIEFLKNKINAGEEYFLKNVDMSFLINIQIASVFLAQYRKDKYIHDILLNFEKNKGTMKYLIELKKYPDMDMVKFKKITTALINIKKATTVQNIEKEYITEFFKNFSEYSTKSKSTKKTTPKRKMTNF